MSRKRKSRARRIAVLALILLGLLALGVALLDDASGPPQASSTSTPPFRRPPSRAPRGRRAGRPRRPPSARPRGLQQTPPRSQSTRFHRSTPTFTQTPPDPSSNATSRFAWTSSDPLAGLGHLALPVQQGERRVRPVQLAAHLRRQHDEQRAAPVLRRRRRRCREQVARGEVQVEGREGLACRVHDRGRASTVWCRAPGSPSPSGSRIRTRRRSPSRASR